MTNVFTPDELDAVIEQYRSKPNFNTEGEFLKEYGIKAEQALGVTLPESYKYFICKYGSLNFGALEIYGFNKNNNNDFHKNTVPNVVWFNLNERKTAGLPHSLIAFETDDDGVMVCLDTSQFSDGECKVIIWNYIEEEVELALNGNFAEYVIESLHERAEITP
jgi:hypothetical protein